MAEYIERSDLEFPYMTMAKWGLNIETCHAYNEGVKAAADYIASIPAADVVPVAHGEWEEADDGDGVVCSVCREDFCTIYLETERFNYCPNCGADMRERKGDE